ncbi:MAG: hypothetical protein PF689_10305 [Deltaproteobacteria bacterium]|jgi:hypothetical protein|nr:hypothetical protein [Deltaproteobacteria bacterium]
MKKLIILSVMASFIFLAACDDDSSGNNENNINNTNCVDEDLDTYNSYDATDCPTGEDMCDDDEFNWTSNGCENCVDSDADGYGTDCDLGPDCDDTDETIFEDCPGTNCVDEDLDTYNSYDATDCPTGEDMCDDDEFNWTSNGCENCVDSDADGYGTDCDWGPDCDDTDEAIFENCPGTAKLFYYGDFEIDGEDGVSYYDTGDDTIYSLSLTDIEPSGYIDSMAVSPDGNSYVVSGEDVNGDAVLNLYSLDSTEVINLATFSATHVIDISYLSFSTGGGQQRVAFLADVAENSFNELFVVRATGAQAPEQISEDIDVSRYQWSSNGTGGITYIAFSGVGVSEDTSLYVTDISVTTPEATLIEPSLASSWNFYLASDDTLYYKVVSNEGVYQLWTSDVDGTNQLQVAGTIMNNSEGEASVGTFSLSPSETKLAFGSNANSPLIYDIYVMDIATGDATLMSDIQVTADGSNLRGPDFYSPITWNYDETALGVIADWQTTADPYADGDNCVFIVPAQGSAGGFRILTPTTVDNNQDAKVILFTADGLSAFVLGDLVNNNDTQIYHLTDLVTADQDASTIILQDVVGGGDVDYMVLR